MALIRLPPGTPPPISSTISRSVVPMGTSTRPVWVTFPARAKTLVPPLFWVPMRRNQSAPYSRTTATLANVSTLLITVGLPHRPLSVGKGGRIRGWPRSPSIEWIRAVSSPHTNAPRAEADLQVEIEARAEDVLAQEPPLAALGNRVFDPLDGQRILGPDVEEPLLGADREAADEHAFDHVERVGLEHAAIHERARVALVGVDRSGSGSSPWPRRPWPHFWPVG